MGLQGINGTILEKIMEKKYESPEAAKAKFEEILKKMSKRREPIRSNTPDKFWFPLQNNDFGAHFWLTNRRVGFYITENVSITTVKQLEALLKFMKNVEVLL